MTKELNKAIKESGLIMVACMASGITFTVTKTLARHIAKRSEHSEGFKYRVSGATLILQV